ncbi:MAG: conjugative transposon protein TraN [Prevotellaceae bacterium]|nr:conjugative transposon protein TraN [Prevotellaceae bacterium]
MLNIFRVSGAETESKTILLSKKSFVYLVFDAPIQDIIYDADGVEDERANRKDMIGMRFSAAHRDTAPLGCLVVMDGDRLQHLWLRLAPGESITPVVRIRTAKVVAGETETITPTIEKPDTAAPAVGGERDSLMAADRMATEKGNHGLPVTLQAKAKALMGKKPSIFQLGGEKGKITVLPQAIGVDATHLYLLVEASNTSNVDYYIDIQGFQIDYKRKGLAAGANGKEPLLVVGTWDEPLALRAQKKYRYVLVYELFTLKKNQALEFFIRETNGGRNIDVEVPSKYLYENTYQL